MVVLSGAPLALAQDSPAKSSLRILLVGQDPLRPKLHSPPLAAERTYELYFERTAAFETFLHEHFANVRVAYGRQYAAWMSDVADVTLFDTAPNSRLPHDFARPALMTAGTSSKIGRPLGLKLDWL